MALATASDVKTSLMRELTEVERTYVDALLDRAERLLRARIPDLYERAAADANFADLVSDIEAEAVARVFRAPENGIMRTETEGNYSYALNLQVASGLLDILERDWKKLGASVWGSVAPATDGYAATRYGGIQPPWWYQYGWPARNEVSESWEGPAWP